MVSTMIFSFFLMPAIYAAGVWTLFRQFRRRSDEILDREDGDETKRLRRLRRLKVTGRWAVALSCVCFSGAATVLSLRGDIEFAILIAGFGVMFALAWKVNQWSQVVEGIEEIAERRLARASMNRRRIILFGRVAVAVLAFQIMIWIVRFIFGVTIMPPALIEFVYSGDIEMLFGMFVVAAGLAGLPASTEPHCFKCGYPYDTVAKPTRCPECGEVLAENLLKHARWVRLPRMIAADDCRWRRPDVDRLCQLCRRDYALDSRRSVDDRSDARIDCANRK